MTLIDLAIQDLQRAGYTIERSPSGRFRVQRGRDAGAELGESSVLALATKVRQNIVLEVDRNAMLARERNARHAQDQGSGQSPQRRRYLT